MADENLYHKLIGLPEELFEPTYFEMLQLPEGDVMAPDVEDQYKKQIQKVQRFTNNPKYKEGALFLKGELRKARSALVDEARRAAYMRDLLTKRTTAIRTTVKPLLIKGYLVDIEYKFLAKEAAKKGVPEPVVQQVLKQELEKKGIDPTTAMVEGDAGPGMARSKSVVSPSAQKRKGRGPMSLTARFPWLRYITDPSELFTAETGMAIVTFPLWLLGIKKSAPRPGQPVAGGLVFHAPFVAALLIFFGLAAMMVPYGEADVLGYKADVDWLKEEKAALEEQVEALTLTKAELTKKLKRATGGGTVVDDDEIKKLRKQVETLRKERDDAIASKAEVEKAKIKAEAQVEIYKDIIKGGTGGGSGDDSAQVKALQQEVKDLKDRLKDAKQEMRKAGKDREKAQNEVTALRKDLNAAEGKLAAANRVVHTALAKYFSVWPIKLKLEPEEQLMVGSVKGGGGDGASAFIDLTHKMGLREGDTLFCVRVIYIAEMKVTKARQGKPTATADVTKKQQKVLTGDLVFRKIVPKK